MHRPSCAPRQWLAPRRSLSDGGSTSRSTCCGSVCDQIYPGPRSGVTGTASIRAGEPWHHRARYHGGTSHIRTLYTLIGTDSSRQFVLVWPSTSQKTAPGGRPDLRIILSGILDASSPRSNPQIAPGEVREACELM